MSSLATCRPPLLVVAAVKQSGALRPRAALGLTERTRAKLGGGTASLQPGAQVAHLPGSVPLNWVKAKLNAEALCAN